MKTIHIISFLFLLGLIFSCSSDDTEIEITVIEQEEEQIENVLYFPSLTDSIWETTTLLELGWNTEAEQELYNFLEENDTKAFLVLKNGRIVLESYFENHTQDSPWYWASAGKTLTAFTVGLAIDDDLLITADKTSDYLGKGWTSLSEEKENLITIRHQLTMTTGLDEATWDCTTPNCLTYLTDAGARWAYHNAPYTLIQNVVASASDTTFEDYFNVNLANKIGMNGRWIPNGSNNMYWSTARDMARFGLLNLNNGVWDTTTILNDKTFINDMKAPSQELNQSYGYLWWLNGKESAMIPSSQMVFDAELIAEAPDDLFAGLGKNDQKLYVVPSQNLVVVRMGEDTGEDTLGPSGFDNMLWEKLNAVID